MTATCLMLVDTPVAADRRVRACIAAYEASGVTVEIVNVRQLARTPGDWARAAPDLVWQTIRCTLVWLCAALCCLARYRYLWQREGLARYGMRRAYLPQIFWYETYVHLWKGVVHAQKYQAGAHRFEHIHAHDLASLSFAQPLCARWGLPVIYDTHELAAFRNRPRQSWLSGLLITAYETVAIRRAVIGVIAVSPFCLTYLRFFLRRPLRCRLVVNDFFAADDLAAYRAAKPSRPRAVVYIGSLIAGRGLDRLVDLYAGAGGCDVFIYSPEDTPRQRSFGAIHDRRPHVHVRYGSYDAQIKADLAPYREIRGWLGVEDICLSYHYALPNKLFQYLKYNIPPVEESPIRYYDPETGGLTGSHFFRNGRYAQGELTYGAAIGALLAAW